MLVLQIVGLISLIFVSIATAKYIEEEKVPNGNRILMMIPLIIVFVITFSSLVVLPKLHQKIDDLENEKLKYEKHEKR